MPVMTEAVLLASPHQREVKLALYPASVPPAEGVRLGGHCQVVVVDFTHSCEARMEVWRNPVHAEHAHVIWQHARQGMHHC